MKLSKNLTVLNVFLGILIWAFLETMGLSSVTEIKIDPVKTEENIKIDGILNEMIWHEQSISGDFFSFFPTYGEKLTQDTLVFLTYNNKNLYFAVKCYDSQPGKIKTSISKRDNITSDDCIGIVIDTMGNRQSSYEFYVNPNGIQEDGIATAVTDGNMDKSPDFVWQSAGKITDDGYQIEISIPLSSIRFKGGDSVKMGLSVMRAIPRLGKWNAWPEIKVGQTQFNHMAVITFKDIKKRLNLEILPNITYNRSSGRENTPDWDERDIKKNIGASLKYGISSSITSEATFNPDFSQVESDAFQVEVNQRYPIFYSEKRPFFMEGMNVFDFGLVSMGMMTSAVHTRQITDPQWAAKLSGTIGNTLFAVLTANDQTPGSIWNNGINPNEGREVFWGIARMKHNLGRDNSIGLLYSGRQFAGGTNNVIGADMQYRLLPNLRMNVSYLNSQTKDPDENNLQHGFGINAMAEFQSRGIYARATFERYDQDFSMYSAFLRQNNLRRGNFLFAKRLYPNTKDSAYWIQKIEPYILYTTLHDYESGLNDITRGVGIRGYFTKNGMVRIVYQQKDEGWQGQLFKLKYINNLARVQLFKWMFFQGSYNYGDQIYYDIKEPFLGYGPTINLELSLQPNIKSQINFQWIHNTLNHKTENRRVYTVDIYNILTSYQFNRYFFIRGAIRYNNMQKRLLTDFLASFTLIPGTVMHLGYGSQYEQKSWQNDQWISGFGDLTNVKNSLYLKISYLWQIK